MKRRTLLVAGLLGPTIVGAAAAGASGTGQHELRLKELGLALPPAPNPVATYVAYRRSGSTLYLAGLGPALSEAAKTRGRVGRGTHKSYCILLRSAKAEDAALEKLRLLEETSDGFKIAEADLKIRGPGDILGTALKRAGEKTDKKEEEEKEPE